MSKSNRFSPEVRERAVRVAREHRGEYPSLLAAIESMAPKIGLVPQTLHERVRRRERSDSLVDHSDRPSQYACLVYRRLIP